MATIALSYIQVLYVQCYPRLAPAKILVGRLAQELQFIYTVISLAYARLNIPVLKRSCYL